MEFAPTYVNVAYVLCIGKRVHKDGKERGKDIWKWGRYPISLLHLPKFPGCKLFPVVLLHHA